ncbi:hypothetical protein [Legionella drancourtii]|uniref:Uncharacterized protein n=1 Tax=Legionella drancourtii LLAP12 TaxID=658187 RepID=G9EP61_9GAMM|nr:hypothetical protein [Legionella drancourtii]EHL30896.1 hypothetical protein LDG_7042 [Legionella drancourtii LLAP12]
MEESTLAILLAASFGGTCLGGILSYFLCKPKSPKLLDDIDGQLEDMKNYRCMVREVGEERTQIFEALKNISVAPKPTSTLSYARFKIFSPNIDSYQRCTLERSENEELVHQLNELINSYPDFVASRFGEPGYIRDAHNTMVEHHAKVMTLAQECFKRIEEADAQREQLAISRV